MSPNVAAFLTMVANAELGKLKPGLDPYRVCVAFDYYCVDLSTHPGASGLWKGWIIDKGKYKGIPSTAAGRYQINCPTWKRLCTRLNVHNFFPQTQDDMAVELIKEAGALQPINVGDIDTAIHLCSHLWASLSYSDAGQNPKSLDALLLDYRNQGGVLVA